MPKQHIVKSIFWLTVSEIIFNISGYLVHSGVGRILGPADYGRYGLVVTLTTMIIVLIGNGIPTAMSKYLSESFESKPGIIKEIKRKALLLQFFLIGSITLLLFLLAPIIANLLDDPTLTPLFRISSLIIPAFASASFYFYYFTGIHKFNLQAILKTIRSIAKVIFIVGFAYLFSVEGSIAGYIAAPFAVFLVAYLIDKFWIDKKFPADKNEEKFDWHKLVNYAWPITLFLLFYEIMISIDLYMIKSILQDDFLTGIYNASLTVGRIPYYLFYALTIVLLPTISKTTAEKDTEETKSVINQSLRLMLILLIPGAALMSIFATGIITLFYGDTYALAAGPMSIIVIGVAFLTVFYVLSFVLNGAGKIKIPMWLSLFGAIINSILNFILIQKFALYGAAIATTITSLIMSGFILYFIKKYFDSFIPLKDLLKSVLALVFILIIYNFIPQAENLWFIFWGVLLAFIYFLILFILKGVTQKDLELIKKIKK